MALQTSSDPQTVAISAFALAYFGEDIDAAVALLDNALRLNPSFAKGWYMSGFRSVVCRATGAGDRVFRDVNTAESARARRTQ